MRTNSKSTKVRFSNVEKFSWQRGYGAFSADAPDMEILIHYRDTQEQHHPNFACVSLLTIDQKS
jgi:hypothetical protein